MPYYAGDFYQGDPGFLSGFLRLGRKVAGRIAPHIPFVGPAISAASAIIKRHPTISAAGSAAAGGIAAGVAGTAAEHIMRRGPVMPGGSMLAGPLAAPGGIGLKGYHMSKPRRGVPSHLVRNRHMRVTNPRALRRAIRRAKGFERLARKVMHFVSPRAHKGRAVFKTRRRARA